jgi:hypothetical protein
MPRLAPRPIAIVALVASLLGLVFAAYSTDDYAAHLDRQVHAVHCSFIPGAAVSNDEANPCKTALFSPYSALFREKWWGGVPISLFALGAFGFFFGFSLYLLLAGDQVPKSRRKFFAAVSVTPLLASCVMFLLSLVHLHAFCKVCVGIYFSSALLAASGVLGVYRLRSPPGDPYASPAASALERRAAQAGRAGGNPRPGYAAALLSDPGTPEDKSWVGHALWFLGLGVATVLPAIVYVNTLPDYRPLLDKCGKLALPTEAHGALLKVPTAHPVRTALLFEDPLCPTCKAFHERLVSEGIFDRLDVTLAMFPLDSDCNWMLDRPLHPGACVLAKAVLCGGPEKARAVLEWSYDNQDELRALGKVGADRLATKVGERWGADMATCVGSKAAGARLNQNLHFASSNHVPVSTPQMFLGEMRICDEDTDLGLKYTMAQLAPEVLK